MPTENRSSNTENLPCPFCAGRVDPEGWLRGDGMRGPECESCGATAPTLSVWNSANPTTQPHPDPIAWMVGTAFWWTKEEAERDAAATGLPIVGLGPMAGVAPVEILQGKPVAWLYSRPEGQVEPVVMLNKASASDRGSWDETPLYTHAGVGEVERSLNGQIKALEALNQQSEKQRDHWMAECESLRAQLRLITGDYRTAIVNGHERITLLGGDCDSVDKMLADNPNYANAHALLNRKP